MTAQPAPSRARTALLVCPDEWSARSLASVLQPAGYQVLRVANTTEAEHEAQAAHPDVILLVGPLADRTGIELCQALRHDPLVAPGLPIVGIPLGAISRELRLNWLRAGAWDVFGFPVDVEELLVKLDGYLREADRARGGLLVDPATGLYNARGLERRARELLAEAVRLHSALACVVFGPEVRAATPAGTANGGDLAAVRTRLGALLRAHARLSDTVGWWNGGEFAVLAPATDAAGAVHLAERLAQAIETAPPQRGALSPALQVRVGYEALADVHATPLEAPDLLAHAAAALARARTSALGARIQQFHADP